MATSARKRNTASSWIERQLEKEAIERQLSKEMFHMWRRTLWEGASVYGVATCWYASPLRRHVRFSVLFVEVCATLGYVGSKSSPGMYSSCQDNIHWWQTKLHCGMTQFRLLSKSYFHPCSTEVMMDSSWKEDVSTLTNMLIAGIAESMSDKYFTTVTYSCSLFIVIVCIV